MWVGSLCWMMWHDRAVWVGVLRFGGVVGDLVLRFFGGVEAVQWLFDAQGGRCGAR